MGGSSHTPPVCEVTPIHRVLAHYEGIGDRYTTYPPASRWARQARPRGLTALQEQLRGPVELYVHVPFCVSRCALCTSHVVICDQPALGDDYLDRLGEQLQQLAPLGVQHLSIGGGTPTWLDAAQLDRLFAILDRYAPRQLGATATVGIDPEATDPEHLDALARAGVTQLRIGIQSLSGEVLRVARRQQSLARVRSLVLDAWSRGVRSIHHELMIGMPHQTPETLSTTLSSVLSLKPDRVSLIAYRGRPHGVDPALLPTAEARTELVLHARRVLLGAGYVGLGMGHYATPTDDLSQARRSGRLGWGPMGYTAQPDLPLIGIGTGAISAVHGRFAQQETELQAWSQAVFAGAQPVARFHEGSRDDRLRADVIHRLLCQHRIQFEAIEEAWGIRFEDTFRSALAHLDRLQGHGLVRVGRRRITVTEAGRLVLPAVAASFDAATRI